jgi:hypothetical protein
MRTKTLLLSVALGAASIAAAMAQTTPVYSVNIVGYVNKQIPAGYSLIANPLKSGNNTLPVILPTAPDGASVYKWDVANQNFKNGINYFLGAWDDSPDNVLIPGDGAFIYIDPSSYPTGATLTFVGEVPTGTLTQHIPLKYSVQANQVPQVVDLTTVGFPATDGDSLYFWDSANQKYFNGNNYFLGAWDSAPMSEIAGAFFVYKDPAGSQAQVWTRTFNVN